MTQDWTIDSARIGGLELGATVPRALLETGEAYEGHFADGLPDRGIRTVNPKMQIALGEGEQILRMHLWGTQPRTAAGIGVGSTLAELRAAYPDATTRSIPPTLGEDLCNASTSALPDVYFHFRDCSAAEAGEAIIRIDMWRD
jgi:hypothetical protein